MARDVTDSTPIGSKEELISWIAAGEKPEARFRIGTEHEKFPFYRQDLAPVPYEGRAGAGGIRALLEGMQQRLGAENALRGDGHRRVLLDRASHRLVKRQALGRRLRLRARADGEDDGCRKQQMKNQRAVTHAPLPLQGRPRRARAACRARACG